MTEVSLVKLPSDDYRWTATSALVQVMAWYHWLRLRILTLENHCSMNFLSFSNNLRLDCFKFVHKISHIIFQLYSPDLHQTPVRLVSNMMTSSNANIFRVTGPLCGEFTGPGEFPTQSPVTRSFDVSFGLRLNKRLSKQPWGWWFETPSWSLWRQCNEIGDESQGNSIISLISQFSYWCGRGLSPTYHCCDFDNGIVHIICICF